MRCKVPEQNENIVSMLSPAQIETLRHVFEHKNSKQIARIMGVSPHTVDERVRRALRKLKVSSRIEAAQVLASNGIFDHVTPYQSLTYQMVGLEEHEAAAILSQRQGRTARDNRDNRDNEDHRALPVTSPVPAKRRGWRQWLLWSLLILSTSMVALFAIQFLLVNLGRKLT